MRQELSHNAQIIQRVLQKQDLSIEVVELPESTRTADDAALAIGCQVGQIVKSLVFKSKRSQQAILVLTSGANRVDEKKIEALIEEPLGKADAEFVRQETGFSIGGVPPLGHKKSLPTYIDRDLLTFSTIWAAAGTPNAVFEISPTDLVNITSGKVRDVKWDT